MKPGALLQGTGSLSSLRAKAIAACAPPDRCARGVHDLDERHLRHGVEEVQPDQPRGSRQLRSASGSSMMLEVLVARRASGFMRGSRRAYSSCFASRFSKMASITTSARGTPVAVDVRS